MNKIREIINKFTIKPLFDEDGIEIFIESYMGVFTEDISFFENQHGI